MTDTPKIADTKPCVMEMEPGTYFWCSCGESSKQPFCDGSHKGSNFSPVKVEITEKQKVAWCTCKRSADGHDCDGSHKKL